MFLGEQSLVVVLGANMGDMCKWMCVDGFGVVYMKLRVFSGTKSIFVYGK